MPRLLHEQRHHTGEGPESDRYHKQQCEHDLVDGLNVGRRRADAGVPGDLRNGLSVDPTSASRVISVHRPLCD